MKAVKRRLGIAAIAVILVCLSVSLGTWVVKRQGEMQTVGWSPLFESREQRALTPLKTIEAMAQPKPTSAAATCGCPVATSDCADTKDDCEEEEIETVYGAGCDTVDLTCGCDSWFAPCDADTFGIAGCATYEATCYETDPNCAEPTSDAATCSSGYPTCNTCLLTCDDTCGWSPNCEESTFAAGTCDSATPTCSADTCDSTCVGRATCDDTCYGDTCHESDPNCAETVADTCDCPDTVNDPNCGGTTDDTCTGATCDAFPCEDTWDDTCDCGTVVTTCEGVETCDGTCSGETCDATCDRALPTCDATCSGETCDDTCDSDLPFCGDTFFFCSTFLFCVDTMDFTCDADDPACPGDTIDDTCAWDDPECAEVTLDCPDTWDCEETLDCPEQPEIEMDFGDAPDPTRHTRLANDGARHVVDEDFYLGLRIDEEPDGQPNPAAVGDDIPDHRDDEDGVWFTTSLLPGRHVSLIVEASAEGYLDAWVDANNDADWGGAGEQIFVGRPLVEGFNVLSFDAPRTAVEGPGYSRFRFSSLGYLSYVGAAADGEVEDHYLPITEAFGAAIKTDSLEYVMGEDATVTFYVNEAADVRLVEDRSDERPRVLWSGTVAQGTHRLRQVPITGRIGRGTVALVATSPAGSTTAVSTPFDVARP